MERPMFLTGDHCFLQLLQWYAECWCSVKMFNKSHLPSSECGSLDNLQVSQRQNRRVQEQPLALEFTGFEYVALWTDRACLRQKKTKRRGTATYK